ncbi:BTB/POZ domain-containing protein 1-like [Gigantopelta aegis]|uniref:BTB/POZ domain-containing protein 1-like n=1 Tax=Gigantopelta aegis TaxID=1735272 RepID=UPI001B88C350|nr:BTB/POZ domain-containing protein 1-like [Gigantopelta aegis]XP_041366341.1 BTB/POZ domain-containing protein 1-like [Gigantopelta aegis]
MEGDPGKEETVKNQPSLNHNGGGGANLPEIPHTATRHSYPQAAPLSSSNLMAQALASAGGSLSASPTQSNLANQEGVTNPLSALTSNILYSNVGNMVTKMKASNSLVSTGNPFDAAAAAASTAVLSTSAPSVVSSSVPTQPQNQANIPYNWQASKVSVKDRLAYLFNTDIMADINFLVGKPPNTQNIPAHKFVLSVGSAVFDALFNGGMATTESLIEIPDVEPAAFLALLRFLYSDEVQIGPETVMTTLYTAKKYAVPALERACVEFLKRNLSSDNAFMLLTQARLFDEPQLAALCLDSIDKNTTEALAADGFTDIDNETLCVVLERDTLGIRECKLFSSVCKWAESECGRQNVPVTPENERNVLGRSLRLIRFPLMTVEEFAMGAAQSGILEDREVVELFLYFTVNPKPPISFLDVPRCCLTGKEQVVSRFCHIESRWGYSGTSDRIRFMVNRRIFVVGFGLYGSIHGPTEYAVNIQIIHTDTGKVMGSNDTSFQCDGSTSTFRVLFKEPVEIMPNSSYIACSTLKGPDSYYGSKGLRKVTHESVSSGKVTFQFTYAAGNNNGTSVEDGQIPEIIFYT